MTDTRSNERFSLLNVDDLHATYREGVRTLPVLDGVSLSVGAGEFVAVIGPSGSGKSTLLDLIAGLNTPERGEIRWQGQAMQAADLLGRSAYMHQRDLLLPWRTVVQNASLALEARGERANRARALAQARLAEFELEGFANAYPAQLSGGMRQRVAFLRTILADRPLLLLDEPFGALDALTRATMQDWLRDLLGREQRAALLVTHDVEEAIYLADRVVVLSGRPARVLAIEPVPFPRPRTRAIVTSQPFVALKARILTELGLLDGAISG